MDRILIILKKEKCRKWAVGLKFNDSEKNGPQGLICFSATDKQRICVFTQLKCLKTQLRFTGLRTE